MISHDVNTSEIKEFCFYKVSANILIFFGLLSFSISLFLPVFFTSAKDIYGLWVLAIGWMGLVILQLAWYANPLNLLALLLANKHPIISLLLSILAIALASCSFIFYEIPTGLDYEKVYIQEFGLGFYFWFAAHLLTCASLIFGLISSKRDIKHNM